MWNAHGIAYMDRPVRSDERPRVYPEGRRCSSCDNPLSRFNPGPRCNPCIHGEDDYTGWAGDLVSVMEDA